MKGSSQNYDGGTAPRRPVRITDTPPVGLGRARPKNTGHGVGAQTSRCYCGTCGAKKVKGECPRCGS